MGGLRRAAPPHHVGRERGTLIESWSDIDVLDDATRGWTCRRWCCTPATTCGSRSRQPELGTLIPGPRLVPLDSGNHLLRADEPAWAELLAEIDTFLAADGA